MGLMKKLTSAVVASSLVLASVGTVLAAPTTEQVNGAFERLATYDLARGRATADGTDPALGEAITRAELVTLLVRAWGQEENAKLLQGAASFKDVSSTDWFSGNVAMAKAIVERYNLSIGVDANTFEPTRQVKAVEVLAFAMKFLGIAPGTGANWAEDTVKIAIDNGIITEADAEALLDDANGFANRGLAFAIADAVFSTAKVGDVNVYQAYVDDVAPELDVDDPADLTTTATTMEFTGSVDGYAQLFMNSEDITESVVDGKFAIEVALEVGANEVVFTAIDAVGNKSEKAYEITRTAGVATKVLVELGDGTIAAGAEADLVIKALDENDVETEFEGAVVTVGGEIGTYDEETGKFTAATKAGTGTITVTIGDLTGTADVKVVAGEFAKVVADKESAAPGEMVLLTAQDEYGNVIEGATFTQDSADAMLDGTTGKFLASKAGTYTVTGKVGDVEKTATVGIFSGFSSAAKVVVEAPETVVANDASVIKVTAKVVDANGNVIKNAKANILNVTAPGLTVEEKSDANGVATYEIKAPAAMQGAIVTLTGTATQDSVNAQNGTTTVRVLPQVATSIKLEAPNYLAVNQTNGQLNTAGATADLTVLDQDGKAMQSGGYGVTVTLTGAASLDSASKVTTKTFYYVGTSAGTPVSVPFYPIDLTTTGSISFSASLSGLNSASAQSTAAYAAAEAKVDIAKTSTAATYRANDPSTATLDNEKPTAVTFEVQLRDTNGVPVAKSGVNVTFDLDVDYADYYLESETATAGVFAQINADPIVATDAQGVAKLVLRSKDFVGDLKVTAKSGNLTTSDAIATFVAGPANSVAFTRSSVKVAQGTEAVELTAQLYDKAGNKAIDSGKTISFRANGTDTWVNGSDRADVTTDDKGQATVKVTTLGYVRPASNPYNVTINLGDSTVTLRHTGNGATDAATPTVAVVVDNSVVANLSVKTQVLSGATWGDKFYVTQADQVRILVTAYDNRGAKLDGETIKVTFPKETILDGAAPNASEKTVTLTPVTGSIGEYEVMGIQFVKAPTVTYTVTDSTGVADLKISGSIGVQAGVASKLNVANVENGKLTITKGAVSGPFVLNLTDNYGNPVVNTGSAIKVTWTYPTVNAANGEYFEIKTDPNGPRIVEGNLEIPVGASGVTFYVFTNVDGQSITFSDVVTPGGMASASPVTFDIP